MKNKVVAVSLDEKSYKKWKLLPVGTRSYFLRVALEDMVGILTWHELKKRNPVEYFEKDTDDEYTTEQIRKFNEYIEENETKPPFLRKPEQD